MLFNIYGSMSAKMPIIHVENTIKLWKWKNWSGKTILKNIEWNKFIIIFLSMNKIVQFYKFSFPYLNWKLLIPFTLCYFPQKNGGQIPKNQLFGIWPPKFTWGPNKNRIYNFLFGPQVNFGGQGKNHSKQMSWKFHWKYWNPKEE